MYYIHFKKILMVLFVGYCVFKFDFVILSTTNNYQDLTFPSAQCQAVCLKKFMKMKLVRGECSKACRNMPDFCENHCLPDNIGCLDGCKNLKEILKVHPGQCPLTSNSKTENIRQPSCLSKCKSDGDCFNTLSKCCSVGCSNLCIEPTFNNSVPKIPPQLKPTEITNSSDIEFEWMLHYKNFVSDETPLTFILQTRVCPCKFYNPIYVGKWQTLIITSQSGARLNAFDQGKIYQFRLAAVSTYGTRGYGPASKPFPNKVERPDNPASPRSLTELLSRLYSSGQISVTIGWQKPEDHVLPISEYVVKWMIDYGYVQSDGQAISALTQFTQSIPPDRVSYVLENLKPNTSYRVEVLSKIYWPGDEPLISEPVVLFLSTPAINFDTNGELYHEDVEGYCKSKTLRHKSNTLSAEISEPIYVNGQIKVNIKINYSTNILSTYRVSWTPKICIDSPDNHLSDDQQKTQYIVTKNRFVEVKEILFSCRYHISIDIIDVNAPKSGSDSEHPKLLSLEGFFCVPSCSDVVTNFKSKSPHCFDHKTKVPPQPQKLSCTLLNKKHKTYKLSWIHPELLVNLQDDIYKSKYRIIWGPRYKEPINANLYGEVTGLFPILDSAKSSVKVLNKDITSLILENLQPQTLYVVKAQLLLTLRDGQEMESDSSIHYFNTGLDITFTENHTNNAEFLKADITIHITYIILTFSVLYRKLCIL